MKISLSWLTVSLAADKDTASKAAIATGAQCDCMRIEINADSLHIVASELGPGAALNRLHDF